MEKKLAHTAIRKIVINISRDSGSKRNMGSGIMILKKGGRRFEYGIIKRAYINPIVRIRVENMPINLWLVFFKNGSNMAPRAGKIINGKNRLFILFSLSLIHSTA